SRGSTHAHQAMFRTRQGMKIRVRAATPSLPMKEKSQMKLRKTSSHLPNLKKMKHLVESRPGASVAQRFVLEKKRLQRITKRLSAKTLIKRSLSQMEILALTKRR